MIDLRARQRFVRFVTDVVVRRPALWRVFRRPVAWMFDSLAPEWDATRISPEHMTALDAALERLESTPGRILDVGTGTGAAARSLARRWPEAEVVGVDVSPGMIAEARARAGSERERYELADASALPFADGEFDLVTLLNMIPFFDELARVTARGGTVVVASSRGASTPIFVPLETVRAELGQRGFTRFAEVAGGPGVSLLAVKDTLS